jgi:hypothetical protein
MTKGRGGSLRGRMTDKDAQNDRKRRTEGDTFSRIDQLVYELHWLAGEENRIVEWRSRVMNGQQAAVDLMRRSCQLDF